MKAGRNTHTHKGIRRHYPLAFDSSTSTSTVHSGMVLRQNGTWSKVIGESLLLVHLSGLTQLDARTYICPTAGGWVAGLLEVHVGDQITRRYIRTRAMEQ